MNHREIWGSYFLHIPNLVTGSEEKEQWVAKSDLPEMDEAGDLANIKKEFAAFTNAKAGFSKKVQKQETRNKMEELRKAQAAAKAYEQIARNESRMRIEREKDVLTKDVEVFLLRSIYGKEKMTKGQAVKEYAQAKRMDIKEVQQIADKIQV